MENRTPIGGIKLSEELVQIRIFLSVDMYSVTTLLKPIAAQQVSIGSLSHTATKSGASLLFTVARDDFDTAYGALCTLGGVWKEDIQSLHGLGSISIFPHRNSALLLTDVCCLFARNNLPIHSLATSISAISITTDYSLIDKACQCIENIFSLPENHAPFRQEFRIQQIPLESGN